MTRVVVLGGGQQGSVIARDLAPDHEVTVADIRPLNLGGIRTVVEDLSDRDKVVALMAAHELVVGALPARLGFMAAQAAIAARRNYVDVAFFAEDASRLDADARAAGVAIMPDCGLAPGISNLLIGRAVALAPRREIHIRVGGVAEDSSRPFGYVITWSPEDLVDEYIRPARYIKDGRVVTAPALSEMELVEIPGVGTLEAFFTDGLRSLLEVPGVPTMTEKTMRWPGHVEAIKPLLADGTLAAELERQCKSGRDLVALRVVIDDQVITLVDRPKGGMSAMARTTALTTAAFARWAATGKVRGTGVLPPEALGRDPQAYRFIIEALAKHEIKLQPAKPFWD